MLFDAIPQAPNLRSGLVNTLIAQIESGDLAPGQRLPTEQEIVAATGVSRTVVREALAALRAEGLITTRQGLGAFVSKDPLPRTFSILPDDLESIDEVLRVLELRMGIEVEATGLAAERRSDAALEQMSSPARRAGNRGPRRRRRRSEEDFGFHRAILAATQQRQFRPAVRHVRQRHDPAPMDPARPHDRRPNGKNTWPACSANTAPFWRPSARATNAAPAVPCAAI